MDTAVRSSSLTAPRLARPRSRWLALVGNGLGLVTLLVILFSIQSTTVAMHTGEVAGDTVVAEHKVTYADHAATTLRRQQAMAQVQSVYHIDRSLLQQRRQQAVAFLNHAAAVIGGSAPISVKLANIRKLLPPSITPGPMQHFASLNTDDFKVVQSETLALLAQAAQWRFDQNQMPNYEISLLATLPPGVTAQQRAAISEAFTAFMEPTYVVDIPGTQQKRKEAAARVAPVMVTIYPGEVVVRRGDIVTPSIMEKLNALGLQSHQIGWRDVLASTLFSIVIVAMLFWYLHAYQPEIVANPRLILLIDLSLLVAVIGARLLSTGHVLLPFFLPLAAISTFAAVVMAADACVGLTLAMAMLAGWIVADSFELTVYYFVTGAAGILAVRQIRQLKQFILAGAYIALFGFLTAVAFALIAHNYDFSAVQDYLLAAAFNGFVSSTLALGGFTLLSGFFGVTTVLQLLELAQPSQPLIKRLMTKTPGTYNHSLVLASMVERAAEDIGANSTVAKLGALYHDVGKTANPHCFVENQFGIGNIHDELRPQESARIIRGHVSQGLKLARQFGLPRVVLDAIAEHHGTMSIPYFLHKAREESGGEPVDPALYSYPGPKPQSKETALLMLADGSESAVRASRDRSSVKIREIVNKIFQERIQQGQLDECPLTLKDLHLAQDAFCSVLNGLYHPRIEYPEQAEPLPEPLPLRTGTTGAHDRA